MVGSNTVNADLLEDLENASVKQSVKKPRANRGNMRGPIKKRQSIKNHNE